MSDSRGCHEIVLWGKAGRWVLRSNIQVFGVRGLVWLDGSRC